MLKRWLLWLTFVVVFTWISTPAEKPPNGTDSRPLALGLFIKADRTLYRMSDMLHLETQLRNVGKEDVYVWESDMCWNMARGLSMRIIGADGKEVKTPFLLDCVPPPPHQEDPYQFVKLAPGTFYGHADGFKLSELVNRPGEYDLDATFNSFLSSQWVSEFMRNEPISKLPMWTMECPAIFSKPIHFIVKRQAGRWTSGSRSTSGVRGSLGGISSHLGEIRPNRKLGFGVSRRRCSGKLRLFP